MVKRFFGGIHPADKKSLTSTALSPAPAPKQVILPMSQHIGGACTPLVKVGDRVLLGQKIGDGTGLCAPIHASVSGVVSAIEPRPHPGGRAVLSVVVENDFREEKAPASPQNLQAATPEILISAISEAGIVGMGGATFPTAQKLRSGLGKVDTLLVNACECEPYITADDCLLATEPQSVLAGARLLAGILRPKRLVLALEDNKKETLEALKKLCAGTEIRVLSLPARYPQGAEKQLIQAATGRLVPPGKLPAEVGCAVFNAGTCAAVARALENGTPLCRRIVTVTGEGVNAPQNFLTPIGTPFSHLLEAAGGLRPDCARVISGGPMMGVAQTDLAVPVCKGTNAILCLTKSQLEESAHPACIRCGRCVAACPMLLQPLYLHQFCLQDRPERLRQAQLPSCIECGCCAYVCPGKLPLVAEFRRGKIRLSQWEKGGAS